MRHLGLVTEGHAPDATAFTEYARLFVVGISNEHCRAIRALFGDRWGSDFHTCIVEDDEFLAAARELFPEEQGATVAGWTARSSFLFLSFPLLVSHWL
jgi:hypothetical protein